MNCEEAHVWLEGVATAAEEAAVADHLRQCPACAQYAAGLAGEDRALQQALSGRRDEVRWERVKSGLAARIDSYEAGRQRRRRWLWAAAGAAAVALCLVTASVLHRHRHSTNAIAGAHDSRGKALQTIGALTARLSSLQEEVRARQILDELEQLQIAFRNAGDAEAQSVAEDAELYLERIMALDPKQLDQTREILAGIKAAGIQQRLQRVRDSIADDAPTPVRTSLELAAAAVSQAVSMAGEL